LEISESVKIIKALADSSRLMIINSLIQKNQYVEELAHRLNLAVSTVSFHLKKLEAANLVYKTKEQYYIVYHINKKIFHNTLKEIVSFENSEHSDQEERIKKYRERVVDSFFIEGKLSRIPSQYKKRLIVLQEIIKIFDPEKIYKEKEIDKKIEGIFEDYCTIRRQFIDEKIIIRKNGNYWFNPNNAHGIKLSAPPVTDLKVGRKNRHNKKQISNKACENKMIDRSQIKKEYKMTHTPMGIYSIKSPDSDKTYFGSSKNLNGIINRHIFELKTGIHKIKELQDAWNKLGENGIKFEILDKLEPKEDPKYDYTEDIETLEDLWAEKLKATKDLYIRLHGTMIKE